MRERVSVCEYLQLILLRACPRSLELYRLHFLPRLTNFALQINNTILMLAQLIHEPRTLLFQIGALLLQRCAACINSCVYICKYCVYMYTYVFIYVLIYIYIYIYIYICIYFFRSEHLFFSAALPICMCICMYTYVFMYTYMYICVYSYGTILFQRCAACIDIYHVH